MRFTALDKIVKSNAAAADDNINNEATDHGPCCKESEFRKIKIVQNLKVSYTTRKFKANGHSACK